MKAYYVKYIMSRYGEVQGIQVPAKSAADAYNKAVFELIPKQESSHPYAAYVYSVTYNNGNQHEFNTMFGKPY